MIANQKFKNQHMHCILTSNTLGIKNLFYVDVWGAYEWTNGCQVYVELWPPEDGLLKP
jgi:hypothetical protein